MSPRNRVHIFLATATAHLCEWEGLAGGCASVCRLLSWGFTPPWPRGALLGLPPQCPPRARPSEKSQSTLSVSPWGALEAAPGFQPMGRYLVLMGTNESPFPVVYSASPPSATPSISIATHSPRSVPGHRQGSRSQSSRTPTLGSEPHWAPSLRLRPVGTHLPTQEPRPGAIAWDRSSCPRASGSSPVAGPSS